MHRLLLVFASCCQLVAGCGEVGGDSGPEGGAAGLGVAGGAGSPNVGAAGGVGASGGAGGGGATALAGRSGGAGVGGTAEGGAAGHVGGAGDGGSAEGGAALQGGSAGEGGSAGGGRPDGCLDFSHFEDTMRMKWDLRVKGTGFEADEGSRLRVIVTYTGEPSYALAETAIQGGAFDITLKAATEPYTGIGVYIDRARNDACDVDVDTLFTRTTGGVNGDYLWEITPDEPTPSGAPPCSINGIFNLTSPLRCPG